MGLFGSLWQDLLVSARMWAKEPGATFLSLLSIALGIGLTTAVFSLGDAMLLRPLPVDKPGELLSIESVADDGHGMMHGWPDYLDMTQAGRASIEIAAYQRRGTMLADEDESVLVLSSPVTSNYFALLGVRALHGRAALDPEAGRPAAVIGHRLWQRRFGGDPAIIGKTIVLSGKPFFVAGVLPAEFTGLARGVVNDIWVSMDAWFDVLGHTDERGGREGQFELIGRLLPGATAAEAAGRLDAAIRGPGKHKPAPSAMHGTALDSRFAPGWKKSVVFGGGLLAVLACVLFVACANVAQLRLAQAETRKKDVCIRIALGAGAWRITRQLLLETGGICLAGTALGVLLARFLMLRVAQMIAAGSVYIDLGLRIDHRVLAFALGAMLFSALIAGLAPARVAAMMDVAEMIKTEAGIAGRRQRRRGVLIAGQLAVTVALFGVAMLFTTSLRNAISIRPGLEPDKKLFLMSVSPGRTPSRTSWCEQVSRRLAGLPGVRGATFARRVPLSGSGGGFRVRVEVPGKQGLDVMVNHVAGNYFSIMGTRVLTGRGVDANDRPGSAPVAVVSLEFARRLLGDSSPLGRWITVDGRARQIAGVVENAPSNHLHESPEPYLYLPFAQTQPDDITLIVETAGEPALLARALRQEVKQFDPRTAVYDSVTLRQHMDQALAGDRTMAFLTGALGSFGVALTAAGLFGLLQYSVSRRTREIGLRMALGAGPSEVQRMVLGDSLRLAAWGIPIGLALLGAAAAALQSMLLGVTALAPGVYVASAVCALAVALAAAWLPSRRATKVDPMGALRAE